MRNSESFTSTGCPVNATKSCSTYPSTFGAIVYPRVSSYVTSPTARAAAARDPRSTVAYVTPMRFAASGVSITGLPFESTAAAAVGATLAIFCARVNHQAAPAAAAITRANSTTRRVAPSFVRDEDSKGVRSSFSTPPARAELWSVIWKVLLPGAPAGRGSRRSEEDTSELHSPQTLHWP